MAPCSASNHRPLLIVIGGPNGSGKTTVTGKILQHEWLEGVHYVNPDFVARDKFGDWNSANAVIQAAQYCEQWREELLAKGENIIFETVMSSQGKYDFILRAIKAGYFVRLFFVATASPEINARRIVRRVMSGGHDVPIAKIISRYQKSLMYCAALAARVDRLYVYDNSVDDAEAQLLFRLCNGHLAKQYVEALPEWVTVIRREAVEQ